MCNPLLIKHLSGTGNIEFTRVLPKILKECNSFSRIDWDEPLGGNIYEFIEMTADKQRMVVRQELYRKVGGLSSHTRCAKLQHSILPL